ncbi:MAG TPA: hypothetical protein VGZ47_20695 [Gemmataceae bacterium]|nr:hypothetical protein [Gemmataceae bacterium]
MKMQRPLPLIQAFLVCQEIWFDERTQRDMLLHPFHYVPAVDFPLNLSASVYLQVKGGHGRYPLSMQLRDLEGEVLWRSPPGEFDYGDPLFPHSLTFPDLMLPIPCAGKYDLIVVMNGEDSACRTLWIGPREHFLAEEHARSDD